jgi:luciferase family oxidoreductase group 1
MLNPSNTFSEESYLLQLEHLQAYFRDEAATQYGPLLAVPQSPGIPEQWILSSSPGGSSLLAAKHGMGLVVARFINGHAGPDIVKEYRNSFRATGQFQEPRAMLAISVLCADTEEKAAQLRRLSDYNLLQFEQGRFEPVCSPDEIASYEFSPEQQMRIRSNQGRIVSGTPETVKARLEQLSAEFGVDELVLTTLTYSQEDRLRSFTLLAETFGLEGRG